MPTTLKNINALPIPTWRRLGVNGAAIEFEPPSPMTLTGAKPVLPHGTVKAHESVLRCAEFKSALSGELAAYARVHSNAGAAFRVLKGEAVAEPVVARFAMGEKTPVVVDNNVVFAEAHSRVTLLLIYDSADDAECFHLGLTRVIAENCADVRVVEIQTLNENSRHFSDFSAVVANGANVEYTRISLGASEVYAGCHMKLEGAKSESRAETFYFGGGKTTLDFSYIARHLGVGSKSTMNASGALLGRCDKIFRGTIDFLRGASGAKGAETENTLMLSPTARSRSCPLILCGEENVEGSHAASAGKPEASKLYYMQSRGLSENEAKRLLTQALMESALKNVPQAEERDRLRDVLTSRIKN